MSEDKVGTFQSFGKIPRLNRDIIITEKIDGTNGQILIQPLIEPYTKPIYQQDGIGVWAGSRNRWVQPENDNMGFARWVGENAPALIAVLGAGRHFGEWWGPGIQRRYGIAEKRFSLFNTHKWGWLNVEGGRIARGVPPQLSVVPVLYQGPWTVDTSFAPGVYLDSLRWYGSVASPGFMRPEGIMVYHTASGHMFKATIEGDQSHKGITEFP